MINSTYKPLRSSDLVANGVNFAGQGVYGEAIDSNPVHVDLTLTDDCLLTGGILMVKGGHFEDTITLQIVHPIAGVVNEFVSNFRVCEDSNKQFEINSLYPAKIYAGLTIRIVYTPSPLKIGVRDIAANYYLHKVLE